MSDTKNESKKIDQEIAREQKMEKLAQEGIDLFPHNVSPSHTIKDILADYSELSSEELEEKKIEVFVPGRIMSVRKMGKATFFHIGDSKGKLQVYLRKDKVSEQNYTLFSLVDIGDMLAVKGFAACVLGGITLKKFTTCHAKIIFKAKYIVWRKKLV